MKLFLDSSDASRPLTCSNATVQERTKALIDSEAQNRALADRFSTLSSVSPVGILQANGEGEIVCTC